MTRKKLSREARIAYLCHLLHERMKAGKGGRASWQRRYKLVLEWERERNFINFDTKGKVAV